MPQSEPNGRPLERTQRPGIFRRGNRYVVRVKDSRGKQVQRAARTLSEARKVKAALTADIGLDLVLNEGFHGVRSLGSYDPVIGPSPPRIVRRKRGDVSPSGGGVLVRSCLIAQEASS